MTDHFSLNLVDEDVIAEVNHKQKMFCATYVDAEVITEVNHN